MLLGCIADDFTGASDLANTLVRGGMAAMQFVSIPQQPAPQGCEAGVVALKIRSAPARLAVDQALASLDWLKRQGCRQFLYKYCSTFDSTPQGNIGPVASALRHALGAGAVVVCPAFPKAGRTLYQGHLFVNDHLLNRSGLESHPLNPMTEPDIRRWLSLQTGDGVGFIGLRDVRNGAPAIAAALEREEKAGRPLVVVDAIEDGDLFSIGAAAADAVLITGGSGIALGLPENFRRDGMLGGAAAVFPRFQGPGAVLSGSCSAATRGQVEAYRQKHPSIKIDPANLAAGRESAEQAAQFMLQHLNAAPMAYSTDDPERVTAIQRQLGSQAAAGTVETFFGDLARLLVKGGVRRLVVAGGETSGGVIEALGVESMVIGPEIDPGVPLLAAQGNLPLGLALKSGNFGRVDFFDAALEKMLG